MGFLVQGSKVRTDEDIHFDMSAALYGRERPV